MNGNARCRFAVIAVAGGVLLNGCSSDANLPRGVQTVDDTTIYLGVMPAGLVQGHVTTPGNPQALHGGTPQRRSSHHVVVALFDSKTGARITDAGIRAGVSNRSFDHQPDTALEPMEINGMMSYGGFFSLRGAGTWRIHLEILRNRGSRPIEADFAYEHVPGP